MLITVEYAPIFYDNLLLILLISAATDMLALVHAFGTLYNYFMLISVVTCMLVRTPKHQPKLESHIIFYSN